MADRQMKIKRGAHAGRKRPKRSTAPKKETGMSSEQPKQRTKRRWPRIKRLIIRLATLVGAALLILTIAVNWNHFSPDNIRGWFSDLFSANSGDGYPVDIDGSSVVSMSELNNSLALVTDTSLVIMNRNGGENHRWSINYSEPLFRTAGKYALVAELGGVRYSVFSRSKPVLQVTSDNLTDDVNKTEILDEAIVNRIISADIRDDGMVALVTEASQSHTSEVRVYTVKGKKVFQLKNSTLMALDVALSPDRDTIAITGVQTQDGVLQSVIRIYDLSDAKLLQENTVDDVMLFSVDYFANGKVFAQGDTACVTVDPDTGKEQMVEFSNRELIAMDISGSLCGVVLQNHGQMDGGELLLIGADGKVQKSISFSGEYRDVAIDGKTAYLLTAQRLHTATVADGLSQGIEVPQDSRLLCIYNHQAMVVGLTKLTAYKP